MADAQLVVATMQTVKAALKTHALVALPSVLTADEINKISMDAAVQAQITMYNHVSLETTPLFYLLQAMAAEKRGIEVYTMAHGRVRITYREGEYTRMLEVSEAWELLQALAWGLVKAEAEFGDQTLRGGAKS